MAKNESTMLEQSHFRVNKRLVLNFYTKILKKTPKIGCPSRGTPVLQARILAGVSPTTAFLFSSSLLPRSALSGLYMLYLNSFWLGTLHGPSPICRDLFSPIWCNLNSSKIVQFDPLLDFSLLTSNFFKLSSNHLNLLWNAISSLFWY